MKPCTGSLYIEVDIVYGSVYDRMKNQVHLHILVKNLSELFVWDQTLVVRVPLQLISQISEILGIWWGKNLSSLRYPE